MQQDDNKLSPMQAFRASRLAQGLCTRCGKKPHRPGKKTCGCDTEYFNQRKQERVASRRCWECNEPLVESERFLRCEACRKAMFAREKRRNNRNLSQGLCAQCANNPPKEGQKWCEVCCDKSRVYALRVKAEVISAYGGCCNCCGEVELGFLTIDHIDGGGTAHRKALKTPTIYGWLRGKKFPSGFQVLCFNCNCGRAANGGVCPHKASRGRAGSPSSTSA